MSRYAAIWIGMGALIGLLSNGPIRAWETKSGNADLEDSDATDDGKEKSQIGLAGGAATNCRFTNRGTTAQDNMAYHNCLVNALTALQYTANYSNPSLGPPTMTVPIWHPGGELTVIDGLCYAERDRDIQRISIETAVPNADLRAKIRKFSAAAGDGFIRVYLNHSDHPVVELDTAELVAEQKDVTAELRTRIDDLADFDVLSASGTNYVVVAGVGVDIGQISITSTDSNLFRTEIALEENTDASSSYCPE